MAPPTAERRRASSKTHSPRSCPTKANGARHSPHTAKPIATAMWRDLSMVTAVLRAPGAGRQPRAVATRAFCVRRAR
eukprot:2910163-Prymnesium_polylepis.1